MFAWIGLGAFIVSNTPVGSVARLFMNVAPAEVPRQTCVVWTAPAAADDCADANEHCPCGHGCPHHGPFAPACPIPGGCALCNVAKVPFLTPPVLSEQRPVCLGASALDLTLPYSSPAADCLARPPRG